LEPPALLLLRLALTSPSPALLVVVAGDELNTRKEPDGMMMPDGMGLIHTYSVYMCVCARARLHTGSC
jgi:hypothetical protein